MISEAFADFFVDFGATVTKAGVTIPGIFDATYGSAFEMLSGSGPLFRCASNAGIARGDTLVVNGVNYAVTVTEPDGTGLTLCRLELA